MSNELRGWQIEQSKREDGKVRREGFLECFMDYILNVWIGWLSQWLWSCLCICNGEWRKNFFHLLRGVSTGGKWIKFLGRLLLVTPPPSLCTFPSRVVHQREILFIMYFNFCIGGSHCFLQKTKFFLLSGQALTAIIPKATDILVPVPLHTT